MIGLLFLVVVVFALLVVISFLFSLSLKMHVLEYHAIMAHVSMKVHHIDVNVNEVMKVQHVIDT